MPREVTPGLRPVMETAGVDQELIAWSTTRRRRIEDVLEGIIDDYVKEHGRLPGERARHGVAWWAASAPPSLRRPPYGTKRWPRPRRPYRPTMTTTRPRRTPSTTQAGAAGAAQPSGPRALERRSTARLPGTQGPRAGQMWMRLLGPSWSSAESSLNQ